MKNLAFGGMVFAAGLAISTAANAVPQDFSFTGSFVGDADVQLFNFTVGALSTVTLRSYSYAGGTMADGTVISAGGFDPILALWDSAGNLVNQWDDGPDAVPSDPVTGSQYDTNLTISSLAAGNYTASIAQYDNFAAGTNLSSGFVRSSSTFTSTYGCSNGQFCDVNGDNRTSFWAFDVLGVESASAPSAVPLPAGLPLMLSGLFALAFLARRKIAA